jgi:hypothetical protein
VFVIAAGQHRIDQSRGLRVSGLDVWLDTDLGREFPEGRAPRGRNETRTDDAPLSWFRRHDEYNSG